MKSGVCVFVLFSPLRLHCSCRRCSTPPPYPASRVAPKMTPSHFHFVPLADFSPNPAVPFSSFLCSPAYVTFPFTSILFPNSPTTTPPLNHIPFSFLPFLDQTHSNCLFVKLLTHFNVFWISSLNPSLLTPISLPP